MMWRAPSPPVRFPLRDALLTEEDLPQLSTTFHSFRSDSSIRHGFKSTEKSRALREVGVARRKGTYQPPNGVLLQEPAIEIPRRPPQDWRRPNDGPTVHLSESTRSKRDRLQSAQEAGTSAWLTVTTRDVQPPPAASPSDQIRDTWSSAARAVLSHTRRAKVSPVSTGEDFSHQEADTLPVASNSMSSSFWSANLQKTRGLPRPVKDWAKKGFEFTDGGLGIGNRFGKDYYNYNFTPGPVYELGVIGSVSLWSSNASMPTKQASAKYTSTEAHTMGARRDIRAAHAMQPGPGAYHVAGFTEELFRKNSKKALKLKNSDASDNRSNIGVS